jgi:hypothetical protein
LRRGDRIERPYAHLWRADGHRQESRRIAGLGAEPSIVVEVLGFIPFLDQQELVGIGIAPQEPDVPKALVKARLRARA